MLEHRSLFVRALSNSLLVLAVAACASNAEHDDAQAQALAQAKTPLSSFDIDPKGTSASGLSSGGFMAVQFHVAFSSSMTGVAVFAGGPYGCAQGSIAKATSQCMASSAKLDVAPFVKLTRESADSGAIDPVTSLEGQNVFLFSGADDRTVNPAVMDALADYYAAFVKTGRVVREARRPGTGHTMPTERYGVRCADTTSPYVGKCGYDGAGAALRAIYGTLEAPAEEGALSGEIVTLKQSDFVTSPAAHSLADAAFAYVPKACADGARCRIHVAFHGCLQSADKVGDAFYRHAGYNEWADTNRIVVLYPQTIAKSGNPNGCWDWWGYGGPDYAKRTGTQMATVKRMVDALAQGGVSVSSPSPSSPDGGAPPSPPRAACVRASNVAHVAEGRAYVLFGIVRAKGSHTALGALLPSVATTLQETRPGYFVVTPTCP